MLTEMPFQLCKFFHMATEKSSNSRKPVYLKSGDISEENLFLYGFWVVIFFFMQNQTQVATALQVFYNLGSLVNTVDEVVNKVRDNLKNGVKEALDPNTLSQAQPNAGTVYRKHHGWRIGDPRWMNREY